MDSLEEICNKIQRPINDLISYHSSLNWLCLETSLKIYDEEQKIATIKNARLETVSALVKLIQENDRVYKALEKWYESGIFMWESGLMEVLSTDIKSKYRAFDYYSFNYDSVKKQPDFYDDQLPYFSFIINEMSLLQFKKVINYLESVYVKKSFFSDKEPEKFTKEKKSIPEYDKDNKITFNADLNENQFIILTECINEVKMFDTVITSQDLIKFFSCTLEKKLKSVHNRRIVYLFNGLNHNNYITNTWQNVISLNELILKPSGCNFINAADLSAANNRNKDKKPSRYETINKYLEQLKIHQTTA